MSDAAQQVLSSGSVAAAATQAQLLTIGIVGFHQMRGTQWTMATLAVAKAIDTSHSAAVRAKAAGWFEAAAVAGVLSTCAVGFEAARVGDDVGDVFLIPLPFTSVPRIMDKLPVLFAADRFH